MEWLHRASTVLKKVICGTGLSVKRVREQNNDGQAHGSVRRPIVYIMVVEEFVALLA